MIGFLRGVIVEKHSDRIIVDVSGVGYELLCSTSTLSHLVNDEVVKVHTYMHVREDILQLFGFINKKEKDLFEKLIGVSKIGPKGALSILSGFTPDQLISSIASKDVAAISSVPGIGKKTAERLVLELSEKLAVPDLEDSMAAIIANGNNKPLNEARDALVSLGYTYSEATNALKSAQGEEELTVEKLLKHAFSVLGK